jgi:hypothetical protein
MSAPDSTPDPPHESGVPLSAHPARIPEAELLQDCRVRFGRASGPGGQHRNKVETAVRITHLPSGIEAAAGETRSQASNRKVALSRLRVKLALEIPVSWEEEEPPSLLWQARCRNGRIVCNPAHNEAPALLAESWAWLCREQFDFSAAARRLNCTASQLLKFLGHFSAACERIQQQRRASGLAPLKFRK